MEPMDEQDAAQEDSRKLVLPLVRDKVCSTKASHYECVRETIDGQRCTAVGFGAVLALLINRFTQSTHSEFLVRKTDPGKEEYLVMSVPIHGVKSVRQLIEMMTRGKHVAPIKPSQRLPDLGLEVVDLRSNPEWSPFPSFGHATADRFQTDLHLRVLLSDDGSTKVELYYDPHLYFTPTEVVDAATKTTPTIRSDCPSDDWQPWIQGAASVPDRVSTVERLLKGFVLLARMLCVDELSSLSMDSLWPIDPEECALLCNGGLGVSVPREPFPLRTIPELLAEVAQQFPSATALIEVTHQQAQAIEPSMIEDRHRYRADEELRTLGFAQLTYGELWQSSECIARGLSVVASCHDQKKKLVVGLFIPRCNALVQAVYGTLRASMVVTLLPCADAETTLRRNAIYADIIVVLRRDDVKTLEKLWNDTVAPERRASLAQAEAECSQSGENMLLKHELAERRRAVDRPKTFVTLSHLMKLGCSEDAPILAPITELATADDICFIQFTSGTTGDPKAIQLTHRNHVNHALWWARVARLHESIVTSIGPVPPRAMLKTAVGFDPVTSELFGPLLIGAPSAWIGREQRSQPPQPPSLVVCEDDITADAPCVYHVASLCSVSALAFTPSLLQGFLGQHQGVHALLRMEDAPEDFVLENGTPAVGTQGITAEYGPFLSDDDGIKKDVLPYLRRVLVGGEALKRGTTNAILKCYDAGVLVNLYGPAECTVECAYYVLNHRVGTPAIGGPTANAKLYVLDQSGQHVVPKGGIGYLWIGGECVSSGYHLRSCANFAELIVGGKQMGRVYCTGDLVRIYPGQYGRLEYLGRSDRQLKRQGVRIDPVEIEEILLEAGASQACVDVFCDNEGHELLVAWIHATDVPESRLRQDAMKMIRRKLRSEPIKWPFPLVFSRLPLPATDNGKIDGAKMKKDPQFRPRRPFGDMYPKTTAEEKVRDAWIAVLNHDYFSMDDFFLSVGGSSLTATQCVEHIRAALKLPDTVCNKQTFLAHPTIRRFCDHLRRGHPDGVADLSICCQPVTSLARADPDSIPLFLAHPIGGTVTIYQDLQNHLQRDVIGLAYPGQFLFPKNGPESLVELANTYVAAMKLYVRKEYALKLGVDKNDAEEMARFLVDFPFVLGGWSFGVLLAQEMCQLMKKEGLNVRCLLEMDFVTTPGVTSYVTDESTFEDECLEALYVFAQQNFRNELPNALKRSEIRGILSEGFSCDGNDVDAVKNAVVTKATKDLKLGMAAAHMMVDDFLECFTVCRGLMKREHAERNHEILTLCYVGDQPGLYSVQNPPDTAIIIPGDHYGMISAGAEQIASHLIDQLKPFDIEWMKFALDHTRMTVSSIGSTVEEGGLPWLNCTEFRIDPQVIGEGGQGKVRRIEYVGGNTVAALKTPLNHMHELAILREMRTLSRLRHPHIVSAQYRTRVDDRMAFIMEYCPQTLERALAERDLPLDAALKSLNQVGTALVFVHSRGFVHGDVTLRNILLCPNRNAKLCDGGSAVQIGDYLKAKTPGYAAPELLMVEELARAHPSIDVFAFGVCLERALGLRCAHCDHPLSRGVSYESRCGAFFCSPQHARGQSECVHPACSRDNQHLWLVERNVEAVCNLAAQCTRDQPEERILMRLLCTSLSDHDVRVKCMFPRAWVEVGARLLSTIAGGQFESSADSVPTDRLVEALVGSASCSSRDVLLNTLNHLFPKRSLSHAHALALMERFRNAQDLVLMLGNASSGFWPNHDTIPQSYAAIRMSESTRGALAVMGPTGEQWLAVISCETGRLRFLSQHEPWEASVHGGVSAGFKEFLNLKNLAPMERQFTRAYHYGK